MAKLNQVLGGRCPVCHFEEFHLVSCQLGQSEAENARLQEAETGFAVKVREAEVKADNLQRLNTQMHEINEERVLECVRLQERVEEAERNLAEQKQITDSIITVDVAGLRKVWKEAEALAERRKKALVAILPKLGLHIDAAAAEQARAAIEEAP